MRNRIIQIYHHWLGKCGWCGHICAKATDGRNIVCSRCKH